MITPRSINLYLNVFIIEIEFHSVEIFAIYIFSGSHLEYLLLKKLL